MEDYYVNGEIDGFSPEEFAEIKLCLETLLSVRAGSVPMDRDFGIDLDEVLGKPVEVAKNILSVEIIEKVRKYEPRVDIESVDFDNGMDGQLVPHIHFIKAEG